MGYSTGCLDVTPEQAESTAIAFLQRAERGIGTEVPAAESGLSRSFDSLMNCYVFMGKRGSAYVNKRTGKVRLGGIDVSQGSHDWPANAISEATARRLAQEYFAGAGFSESLYTHLVEQWNEVPPYYRLFCSPKYNGVPYALNHNIEFKIDAATGKLRSFGASQDWPSPPAHTAPLIAADEARAAMAQKIFSLDPMTSNNLAGPRRTTTLEEFFSVRLNIWLPDTSHRTAWPLAEHIADEQAGRGRLVYTAAFQDTDAPLVEEGVHARRFEVYVDARSGRVLCVYLLVPMGGGPSQSKTEKTLAVKPCTLDVIASGKPVRVGTVSIKPTEPPEYSGKNHSVILRIGKRLLHLTFVPELGLLSTRGETPSWGKPDERLLRVLKRVVPK